jgi:hypothetical protein
MRDKFRQHHRLSEEERTELWNTCTFALDANVLLNVYRYADTTREDFFRVLDALRDRLWLPYQAASEFYKLRIGVIEEQQAKYGELEEALQAAISKIGGGAFRKSAFLGLEAIEKALKPAIDEAKRLIVDQKSRHPNLLREDVYLARLAELVGTAIGDETDESEWKRRCSEAQTRIDSSQPPGYSDAKKQAPERYGDVLIWFELLDYAEVNKRPLIFVTDDEKEDWWQIVSGQKLGPRPELRQEMRKRAGVEFYIATPATLLQTAGQQLKLQVAKASVDDATRVTEEREGQEASLLLPTRWSRQVQAGTHSQAYRERVVTAWIFDRWSNVQGVNSVESDEAPFDLVAVRDNRAIGVTVMAISRPSLHNIKRVVTAYNEGREYIEQKGAKIESFDIVVIVAPSVLAGSSLGNLFLRIYKLLRANMPLPGRITFGIIDGDKFLALHYIGDTSM